MGIYAITGASKGIGAEALKYLRGLGHDVINIDIDGGDISADLGIPEGRQKVIKSLHENCPNGLDGLILNAGIALAATVGAGATAELGAMRISEEIDALEVMGIQSISYLVSTRVVAGFTVIIPLYALALIMAFASPQIVTTLFFGQSSGTYDHYFRTFLRPDDVFWSFLEAIVITAVVMITHCCYGYEATGGPVGVGESVGRSMRFSLISVQVVVLSAALALYGVNPNFALTV